MVIVHVTVQVKPEEQENFTSMMATFIADTLQVASCTEFILYQQVQNKNSFGLYEEWETADDFNAYTQTERFTQFRNALGPLIAAAPVSNRYEAQAL